MDKILAQLTPRSSLLITTLLLLILISLMSLYVLLPVIKSYQQTSQAKQTLVEGLKSGNALAQGLLDRREEISKLSKLLRGDSASLPANQMEAYIIGQLQKMVWRQQVELVAVKPKEGAKVDRFKEMLFEIKLAGNYLDIYNLLNDISETMGIVVVKQYRMTPKQQIQNPTLVVDLTIAAYRLVGY